MLHVDQRDVSALAAIESDLVSARRERRFEDVLHHLDEVFVMHKHTACGAIRTRCAALLGASDQVAGPAVSAAAPNLVPAQG
ncbi:hypothetical protein ACVWW4_006616 [Bradyrhizobium sp. LB7.1]